MSHTGRSWVWTDISMWFEAGRLGAGRHTLTLTGVTTGTKVSQDKVIGKKSQKSTW